MAVFGMLAFAASITPCVSTTMAPAGMVSNFDKRAPCATAVLAPPVLSSIVGPTGCTLAEQLYIRGLMQP
jgi:hypothetical protein